MRTWTIRLAALVAVAGVGLATAQPPAKSDPKPAPAKPDPNSLEAAVAAALKNNPDIKHAEAKVNEANAGLNKARLQVMQSVVTAHSTLEAGKQTLRLTEMQLQHINELSQKAGISKFEVQKAEADMRRAKAEVAAAEAQLALLLGNTPGQRDGRVTWLNELTRAAGRDIASVAFSPDGSQLWTLQSDGAVRLWDPKTGQALSTPATPPAAGSMDARIRDALTKTVKIEITDAKKSCVQTINDLKQKAAADVPFRIVIEPVIRETSIDLMAGELPLSSWLSVIEDSIPGLVFVVREYGILVTSKDRMPDGGLRIREFLRQTEPKKDEAKKQ